jgi:transposase
MQNETTKPKTKPDREAVRVLSIELGAREAARRLGLNEDTVCSWARRYKWNLPQRKNGRPSTDLASTLHTQPGDVLLAEHKSLETKTKTALARATAAAAEHVSVICIGSIGLKRERQLLYRQHS